MAPTSSADRRESSVLFSLRELQSIESRRVEEEARAEREARAAHARVQLAEQARIHAAHIERQRADDEAARHLRDQVALRLREEELRVKEAEVRARADHDAALAAARLAQEMAVRRLAAEQQRPTWLVAAVGIAVVAAAIAVFITVDRIAAKQRSDRAAHAAEVARIESDEAARIAQLDMKAAKAQLDQMAGELADLRVDIDKIDRELATANSAAKRAVMRTRADELRARERELRRLRDARAATFHTRCPPTNPLC